MENVEQPPLAGRWDEAPAALDGRDDPEPLVDRVLILADDNLLARDRTAEPGRGYRRGRPRGCAHRRPEAGSSGSNGLALQGRTRSRRFAEVAEGPLADSAPRPNLESTA